MSKKIRILYGAGILLLLGFAVSIPSTIDSISVAQAAFGINPAYMIGSFTMTFGILLGGGIFCIVYAMKVRKHESKQQVNT